MTVMIGIDPRKASHTAVVIDNTECVLDELRVRACLKQTDQLRAWAAPFPDRVWAIESARGLGYLLAQQLVAAGEIVVDVPAVLSTRTRLLGSGKAQKNDPNDARSKSKAACRLHALLMEPEPGGMAKEMSVTRANEILDRIEPATQMQVHRLAVARETLADIVHYETQMKASMKRLRTAVAASGTSLVHICGVGVVVAAMIIGHTGDISRFASAGHFASYNATAPIEASSGEKKRHRLKKRGNRQLNWAIHVAARRRRRPAPGSNRRTRRPRRGA
jgi:transposase